MLALWIIGRMLLGWIASLCSSVFSSVVVNYSTRTDSYES